MAVAFDAVGPSASGTANTTGTSMTWAHTCGASANLLLVGAVLGAETAGSEGTFSGATYNGVAMTSGGLVHSNNQNAGFVQVFYLLNPPTGSAFNVVVTRTGGGGTQDLIGGSLSYSGAGTPTFTTAFGNSGAPAITVSSAVGDRVAAFATSGSGFTATNQTQRILDNAGTLNGAGNFLFSDAAGAASVTTTDTATSDWWGVVGVQIPAGVTGPSGGGGGPAQQGLLPPMAQQRLGIMSLLRIPKVMQSWNWWEDLSSPASVINRLDLRTNNADASTYDSNTFTPGPSRLLFVMAHGTASVATDTTLTASANGITFTPVADMVQVLSGHTTAWFVADQLTPANPVPMTVTWDCTSDPATGAFLAVAEVDGITRTGLAAIKQTALNPNIAANGAYAATFSTAVTPANPVLGMVAYVGGLSITEPPGWLEIDEPPDMTLPAQGFEWAKRDYGETGTVMTWTASAATNRANVGAVEFDMSPPSGGGLTSVTSTRATSWDTLAPVLSTRATTWNTTASVTATRATTWNTLSTVTASTRATTWNTLAPVLSTRATTWNTRAAVTSTRATTWNTAASVVSTRATTWNTAASVVSTRATTWNTLESVASTRATTWNVLTSLTSVTSTRATTWNTLAAVSSTRATTWNTAASVASTRATTWNTLASVASTRATTWNTRAAVLSTRATTWNTAAAVTSTRATTWNTRAAVLSTRATTWNTLASVASTRATTWNVAANLVSVTSTRATTWNVVGQVTSTRATTWTTRAAVTSTKATSWSVLTSTTSSRQTTWATLALVSSTRATTWRTLASVLSTRATTWNVLSDVVQGVPVANPILTLATTDSTLTLATTATGVLTVTDHPGVLVLTDDLPPTLTVNQPAADLTLT